jgi:NitT/TauT family transport system substrate-binding protein
LISPASKRNTDFGGGMKRRLFLVTALGLVLGLAAPAASPAQEAWRVGTWKTAQTIQPFLYERYSPGVKATVLAFTNPGDQKAALLSGSLDMTGTTLVLAIQAASRGEPVRLVASLCAKCSALAVKKGGPVKTVADLRGRTIGYVPGTMHEILLRETLTRAGIDPGKDARLVRVDFFDMGTALARGDIDAFLSGEPLPTQAVLQGYGEILAYPYFDDSIGAINAGMIVRAVTAETEPEKVAAMVEAHVRATKALLADRGAWLAEASSRFGVPLEVLGPASANMDLAWDMDETFIRRVAALGKRMKELGMIDREPDYAALIDTRFVRRASGN